MAALGVVCHHVLYGGVRVADFPWHFFPIWKGSFYGAYGVNLFFVLSGYLITSLLILDRRTKHYYGNFYWKRVFRILPALLLILAITWALGYITAAAAVLAVLFIQNFNEILHLPASGPFWSLSIEEQFYVVWPAVVRQMTPRTMRRCMWAVVLTVPIIRVVSIALGHGRMHYTFMNCDGLAWGALLALRAFELRVPYRAGNGKTLFKEFGWPLLICGGSFFLVAEFYERLGYKTYAGSLTGLNLIFTGLLAFLITHREGALSKTLSLGLFTYLGSISYMVYLSHVYVLQFCQEHMVGVWAGSGLANLYLRFALVLGISVIFSSLTLYLFERPVGKLRRYFLK